MLSTYFGRSGLSDWLENTAPYTQVRESDDATLLELEVPRYRMDDLRIDADVLHGILTVTGHRRSGDSHRGGHDMFGDLMWAAAPLGDFRRSFSFSPMWYDLSKYTTHLDSGVLSITVPKKAMPVQQVQEQPIRIFGGNKEGQLVTTTTPEEFRQVRRSRWPPTIRREETDTELTYKCEMPATVSRDHIKLELIGRSLVLSITYQYTMKSDRREESQSLSYSTSLVVPEGTKPGDIRTEYDDGGVMTITLAKHPSAAAIEGGRGQQQPQQQQQQQPQQQRHDEQNQQQSRRQ